MCETRAVRKVSEAHMPINAFITTYIFCFVDTNFVFRQESGVRWENRRHVITSGSNVNTRTAQRHRLQVRRVSIAPRSAQDWSLDDFITTQLFISKNDYPFIRSDTVLLTDVHKTSIS